MSHAAPDPFQLEVLRHALTAIAEEMSFVVMRAARSPLLRESGDHSSALTDARGELVAQGRDIPIHLGVMSFTVGAFVSFGAVNPGVPGIVVGPAGPAIDSTGSQALPTPSPSRSAWTYGGAVLVVGL